MMKQRPYLVPTIVIGLNFALAQASFAVDETEILKATGIDAGVALVISDEADLARHLAASGRMIVHLVVTDLRQVSATRDQLASAGLGGRVLTMALNRDGHLPHPDLHALPFSATGDGDLAQDNGFIRFRQGLFGSPLLLAGLT